MFETLGAFIIRFRWLVIIAAFGVLTISVVYGTSVFSRLDSGGFTSKQFQSYQAQQEITDHFDNAESLIVLFSSPEDLPVSDPRFKSAVEKAVAPAKTDPDVTSIESYYDTLTPSMVSYDGKSTFVVINLKGDTSQAISEMLTLRPKITSSSLKLLFGGTPAINQDFNDQIAKDLGKAESISFILLAILLIGVFRSLVAAALPLALGAFGVLGAFLVIRLLTNITTVSQYAINVIILLGLGLSIDYSLFMVSRFREELRHQMPADALVTTMKTAGRTVFFSGLTVILSLLGLLVFPINFLQSMGFGASAAVAVAVIGALTLLPAMLVLLGNKVNSISFGRVRLDYLALRAGRPTEGEQATLWRSVATWAMRRPVLTFGLIVIPLVFMGQYFLQAVFSSADYRSLPTTAQSREVADALTNDFPGGNTNPLEIIIYDPRQVLATQTGRAYLQKIETIPGMTQVVTKVSGDYTYVAIAYNSAYDQGLARDLVASVRNTIPPAGVDVKVGGTTAELVDLLASLGHYAVYAGLTVALALTVLLFIMFRSVIVPLQALFVNFLSLTATFGALVWVFQQGHLSKYLDFTSVGSIDATQPVLIFGIAFGLSMDYSVFLLSRVKEQYDQTGDVHESIAEGVQKTGTIITSAAVLFIVVVAAFATSKIPLIKQIGVGLGLAVFLDAFLVRMLLVPAIMFMLGRANWWSPKFLRTEATRSFESSRDIAA